MYVRYLSIYLLKGFSGARFLSGSLRSLNYSGERDSLGCRINQLCVVYMYNYMFLSSQI